MFTPSNIEPTLPLPVLNYQKPLDDQDRLEMYKLFQYIQQELVISRLEPIELSQNLRGAWELKLSNGIDVTLGHIDSAGDTRKSLDDKLERVGKLLMPTSNIAIDSIERLDTRYPNGIAVKWKEKSEQK